MAEHLRCLSCGQRKVRKDGRVLAPAYKWRCKACGKGWACTPVALDALQQLPRTTKVRPVAIELDGDWSTA